MTRQRPPTPEPARIAAHEDTVLYFGVPMWMELTPTCKEWG